jgi:hypothetical protein
VNVGEALVQAVLKDSSERSHYFVVHLLVDWDPARERWSKSMTMID